MPELPNAKWNTGEVFWGELAPADHIVQLYDYEDVFLDTLVGYVSGGLRSGEGVIIIATPEHTAALQNRLLDEGVDFNSARSEGRFICCDVLETLDKFMDDNWPDDGRFRSVVTDLVKQAGAGGRRVRAFGEMVAVMWAQGHNAATIRLEYLWHELCQEQRFSLLCSYPKSGFTDDANDSIRSICSAHSRTIH